MLLVVLGALSGCVMSPTDDWKIDSDYTVLFQGFSDRPHGAVRIQAYDRLHGRWVGVLKANGSGPLGDIQASGEHIGDDWDMKLYMFQQDVRIPLVAFEGSQRARVRALLRRDDGSWTSAYMFDDEGNECVGDHWAAEEEAGQGHTVAPVLSCSAINNGGNPRTEITVRAPTAP